MSRVLVIGSGAREHALAWKLSRSYKVGKVFVAPGNVAMPGNKKIPPYVTEGVIENIDFSPTDIERLAAFAINERVSLTVVGPESSLAAGVVDLFESEGLPIFGPNKKAAEIESSKQFAKELMKKYNIPTAAYEIFTDFDLAKKYIETLTPPFAIKADGLAEGKGVVLANSREEGVAAIREMMLEEKFGNAGKSVIIEEFLEGLEFSYMALVNGEKVYPILPAMDYSRAFDKNTGSNTGGMGGYAPVPSIGDKELTEAYEKILVPTAQAMVKEGRTFKGLLYAGLMITKNGVKVIEFNARFGDPETGVVLPLMESDLYVVLTDFLAGKAPHITWSKDYCVGVVMASKGYPGKYEKGFKISGLENLSGETSVFFSGVCGTDDFVTNGGRVLLAVRKSGSIVLARNELYEELKKIECENLFYRKDIAR